MRYFVSILLLLLIPTIANAQYRNRVIVVQPHWGHPVYPYTYRYSYPGSYGWGYSRGYYPPPHYGFYFYSVPMTYKTRPRLPIEYRRYLAEITREKKQAKRESARNFVKKQGKITMDVIPQPRE